MLQQAELTHVPPQNENLDTRPGQQGKHQAEDADKIGATTAALICRAATEAGIDPDRVKFKRTVRIVRRRAADPAAFPP